MVAQGDALSWTLAALPGVSRKDRRPVQPHSLLKASPNEKHIAHQPNIRSNGVAHAYSS